MFRAGWESCSWRWCSAPWLLACTLFTAIVVYVGIKTRLKSDEVVTNVENTRETAAEHIDGE